MKNYSQPGDVLEFTAPGGGVVSGTGYMIGDLFVVAVHDAAQGEKFSAQVSGVIDPLPRKVADAAWGEGVTIYWDASEGEATTDDDNESNSPIGVASRATGGDDTEGGVLLRR